MREYPPGTPAWIDVASTDVDSAVAFYGDLFGWEARSEGPASGGYRTFLLGGRSVAGIGPVSERGQPPAWSTYVSVADADETIATAIDRGGSLLTGPVDIFELGRMAVVRDPDGAAISLWQPRSMQGAEVVNEVNSFCWCELATRDLESARRFYPAVFGWHASTSEETGYTSWKVDDRAVAGMLEMTDVWPPEIPAHWMVYFSVADCDAVAIRCRELAGQVLVPVRDIPFGRFAVLADPQGAVFSVLQTVVATG